ncbi:hypothetical protein GA0115240_14542 [Streptomyces sp. DvalAA-14]|uniref:hypothetical protein n=1 Tax=unclassified Streptomyces TaxID=2593676 RepID=UPI00081B0461|nr:MULTISPECIES: hypothetical protein [unclassified Streptomyces]MYS22866.1 hypothetical protein [Streptomyces sp. SID4948]SCE23690.1 hypothetical protein GA0115240_14542 [Streptomyces sp. DvalAA-14]
MTDYRALHLIRDLPPVVEVPGLPGEGGPQRERPAAEPHGQTRPAHRTADGLRGDTDS